MSNKLPIHIGAAQSKAIRRSKPTSAPKHTTPKGVVPAKLAKVWGVKP
ncbi:hypothetical protein [Cobetia crustatorum]|nr:hypothetical protein [Cobetia crustatorum]